VKYGVLFEVRTEYFNIHTSFGSKGLMEKEAKKNSKQLPACSS
jgi:hypothetical protein